MTSSDGIDVSGRTIDGGDCPPVRAARARFYSTRRSRLRYSKRPAAGSCARVLASTRCDVAVVTNIGQADHLGLHNVDTSTTCSRQALAGWTWFCHRQRCAQCGDPLVAKMAPLWRRLGDLLCPRRHASDAAAASQPGQARGLRARRSVDFVRRIVGKPISSRSMRSHHLLGARSLPGRERPGGSLSGVGAGAVQGSHPHQPGKYSVPIGRTIPADSTSCPMAKPPLSSTTGQQTSQRWPRSCLALDRFPTEANRCLLSR